MVTTKKLGGSLGARLLYLDGTLGVFGVRSHIEHTLLLRDIHSQDRKLVTVTDSMYTVGIGLRPLQTCNVSIGGEEREDY